MEGITNKIKGGRLISYLSFGLILIVPPLFLSPYWVSLLTEALIWFIFALSLNLLNGYLGLPSFGHAAFWGLGVYTVAMLVVKVGFEPNGVPAFLLLIVSGVLIPAIAGAIMGLFLVRLSPIIFMMVTLALCQMLWGIAWRWRSLTGGDDGLTGISRPDLGLPWSMANATNFYFLTLLFFLISLFLLYRIVKSPFGNVLVGIRENEPRMRALGYHTWMYKYCAYILAGTFGGLAGVFFAFYNGFASPAELSWFTSGIVMVMVMVGGLDYFIGPIIGAGLVLGLKYLLGAYTEHWLLVMGAIFVLTVLYARHGVAGYLSQLMKKRKTWKP